MLNIFYLFFSSLSFVFCINNRLQQTVYSRQFIGEKLNWINCGIRQRRRRRRQESANLCTQTEAHIHIPWQKIPLVQWILFDDFIFVSLSSSFDSFWSCIANSRWKLMLCRYLVKCAANGHVHIKKEKNEKEIEGNKQEKFAKRIVQS